MPEFVEGQLPDMILAVTPAPAEASEPSPVPPIEPPSKPSPVPPVEEPPAEQPPVAEPPAEPPAPDPESSLPVPEPQSQEPLISEEGPLPVTAVEVAAPEPPIATEPAPAEPAPSVEAAAVPPSTEIEPAAGPRSPAPADKGQPHWMLSLFTPAESDSVDWARGNYTLLARSGRVESPSGSGELKKQLQMVSEGSVIYASEAPSGSAPDVAPEGFAHPVFRAGFALSIPLPEVG